MKKPAAKKEILMGNEKIEQWGVFVENESGHTYELCLSDELTAKVWDFIEENVDNGKITTLKMGGITDGRLEW